MLIFMLVALKQSWNRRGIKNVYCMDHFVSDTHLVRSKMYIIHVNELKSLATQTGNLIVLKHFNVLNSTSRIKHQGMGQMFGCLLKSRQPVTVCLSLYPVSAFRARFLFMCTLGSSR